MTSADHDDDEDEDDDYTCRPWQYNVRRHEAGDKYEYRQRGPADYGKEAGDKYLDVENIIRWHYFNVCTNDADEWLNVRGDSEDSKR